MSIVAPPALAHDDELRRLRTLYQLLSSLSRAKSLDDVYDAAFSGLLAATDADRAAILMFDQDGVLRFKAWRDLSPEYRSAVAGHSPWPKGTEDAQPIAIADTLLDDRMAGYRDVLAAEGIRALTFIPLALEAGVFGKLMLYYREPHCTRADELGVAQAIAAHVALAAARQHAGDAHARSEQQLEAVLDHSAAVIFLKDLEGRFLLVNGRWEQLFRISKKDAIGRRDSDIYAPEMAAKYRANDQRVLAAGKPLTIEESIWQDDGIHDYLCVKVPLTGADGTVTGICGIATDITEQKILQSASLRLASVVENSDDAIISKDLNGMVTSWNRGAERIFGYTAKEMIGRPVSILAPQDLDEMPGILAKIRRGERVEHYETRRRRKDGQVIDVSLTVSPVRGNGGEIIGASKIARDISDRKRADSERAGLLAREQEARKTAELLNSNALRLASELDLKKLVQVVTDAATALVGAEFGSFFHNVIDETGESYLLYTLSGAPREAFAGFPMPRNTAVFGPTFRGEGIVRSDDITLDPRYGKSAPHHGMPKGHLAVRSYLAAPVIARSGEVLGGLFFGHSAPGMFTANHEAVLAGMAAQAAIAMDNARLFEQSQRVQGELRRSNEELKRANQDLEVFAYSASHDLQEPLRTIALSSELLERSLGMRLQGDDVQFLDRILAGSRRMGALIEDLLEYTQATKYAEGPPPAVDAAQVLQQVLDGLRGRMEDVGATVTFDSLPVIRMHEGRLAQVFQNLIGNALKYRQKEVSPRVHISANESDGFIIFSVADNGIGMEPEYRDQIFGLFKRLHTRDQYPGSGIGLSICQRIMDQYGGRIWLEKSVPGQGSTFCVAVPARVR